MHERIRALVIGAILLMSGNVYTAQQYIADVQSGKQIACKYVKLAVERHIKDLARVGKPDFPYYFDEAKAKRAIDFKQQLRHAKGEWADERIHDTRIHLEPWQQFRTWCIFGWQKTSGTRRFTKAYTEMGRKNGKTTDAAADLNYCFFADRPIEPGVEAYCVATKKDQAKIAWEDVRRQIEKHPVLKSLARTYKRDSTITRHDDPAAKCTVWGKDADTQDGFNPHVAICDEMHAWPDHSLLEVIESGLGARRQPLIDIITTAGFDTKCACYQEERTLAVQMLEGTVKPAPENFFAIIYTLDEGDDWTDESVWIKANPNLGVSVSREFLRERVKAALQMPSKRNDILTKNFSIWTNVASRAIPADVWERCGQVAVNPAALAGKTAYFGLDLSSIMDISAYALCFEPDGSGVYPMLWRFFIPGDDLIDRIRRDKVPYDVWKDQGHIITTPGNTIDYDFIEQEIQKDAQTFSIAEGAFDPWHASNLVTHLMSAGIPMVPIVQSFAQAGMPGPTDGFLKAAFSGKIAHGGNPVMDWMISCLELKSDRQGNVMPMKPARKTLGKRIDGVVAAIMALDRAQRHGGGLSVYEERGIAAS
jgi:phage terminase large subunit-like protein